MKVKGPSGSKGPNNIRKVAKNMSGDGSFSDSLKETGNTLGDLGVSQITGSAGVEGILAAQNSDSTIDERRLRQRLMTYGDDLLDRLEDIRLGILIGHFSKQRLTELARRMRQKREKSKDPALDEILAEIELRAEVEIAKYARGT
ncbi:MAG: flagellar assembly protein FliX [Magnetovibrio sp.]|nr:flagellar assembly protein FliX [Magnetovibrio sp.]|tara:strand:+ start:383 stop:817 length:435 start_codon:yes stop_codon:yes gene_type:complete